MRHWAGLLMIIFCSIFILSYQVSEPQSIGVEKSLDQFKINSLRFAETAAALDSAVRSITSNDSLNIEGARQLLKHSRLAYKRLEYFMEYFLTSNAIFYNGAPKPEVEEPYMEWQEPTGLQVIEALLFEEDVYQQRDKLMQQCDALLSSARDINATIYDFKATDEQLLESVRLELIRLFTMGITGFDAPSLKSGVEESAEIMVILDSVISLYAEKKQPGSDSVRHYLQSALLFLQKNTDFDSFDRLKFLTRYGLPLQTALSTFIQQSHLELNTSSGILNYKAKNMFSRDALSLEGFPQDSIPPSPAMIRLGEQLFKEPALSGNNRISCATCHQPDKYFSDGLPKSIGFDGHSTVRRNAPSLFYAGFQFLQFWEGRAVTLEQQIAMVLSDSTEMNAAGKFRLSQLDKTVYDTLVKKAFQDSDKHISDNDKIARSIAAFVRTLNPRNSPFDRYMEGNYQAINASQQQGFNLFMGKAQCGTCHFAPLFNGLVPPYFNRSEVEVLGVPANDDFNSPVEDKDPGRQEVFQIRFYLQAFKTPTVRNTAATAPYMHNGAFKSLEKVVEFYNKGGGRGIGLKTGAQTLSDAPLKLTEEEIKHVTAFLHALNDEPYQQK
jgi:cytochrome c peroxidase